MEKYEQRNIRYIHEDSGYGINFEPTRWYVPDRPLPRWSRRRLCVCHHCFYYAKLGGTDALSTHIQTLALEKKYNSV